VDFTYVPFSGGGAVAAAVVGKQTNFSVNNPLEMVGHWDAGRLRPLGIFAAERVQTAKWKDVPTIKEQGINIEYQMLRGVFGPPSMPADAVAFYQGVFQKVLDSPEMVDFIERGAFTKAWMTGAEFTKWLEQKDNTVRNLMVKGGLAGQ
jgi:tripartite-type tricarboxylate transporter receptor subunit TctC